METTSVGQVFVAGGQPTVTYVTREEAAAENNIKRYITTRHTILSVTGPTKSGKTVLCRRVIPSDLRIDISGGLIDSEEDFWNQIFHQLDLSKTISTTERTEAELGGGGGVSASVDLGIAKIGAKANTSAKTTDGSEKTVTRAQNSILQAIETLKQRDLILLIDDFHFVPIDVQTRIVRSLKQPIFDGLRTVVVAVPHRGFDVERSEKDLGERISRNSIPDWKPAELEKIAIEGFGALNVMTSTKSIKRLAEEAYGSPMLMQKFCQELCLQNEVFETLPEKTRIGTKSLDTFLKGIAKDYPSHLHHKLARGKRSDRKPRQLNDGTIGDIYIVVLRAIAECLPNTRISHSDIRNAVQMIVSENPATHEITRVIQKISEIAKEEAEGDAAIEWDAKTETLFVIDASFAFYLKWGFFEK